MLQKAVAVKKHRWGEIIKHASHYRPKLWCNIPCNKANKASI